MGGLAQTLVSSICDLPKGLSPGGAWAREPLRVSRRLDPYPGSLRQPDVESSGFSVLPLQPARHYFPRRRIQQGISW